jgi:hypothetical protein
MRHPQFESMMVIMIAKTPSLKASPGLRDVGLATHQFEGIVTAHPDAISEMNPEHFERFKQSSPD